MPNPVINQIFKHRSVRKFDSEAKIPREDIDIIIKSGQQASTSCSGQMYSIIEISKDLRKEVFNYCGKQQFVLDASYFCIILLDLFRLRKIVEQCGAKNPDWQIASMLIGTFDAGLLGQNMTLAAESLGYDICFCGSCGDNPEELIKLLNLPEYTFPLTGLAIGKGAEDPPIRPRLQTSLVHHLDKYNNYSEADLEEGITYMNEKLAEEGYYINNTSRGEGYTWRDHMKNKFGGIWLEKVEERRKYSLIKQKFMK